MPVAIITPEAVATSERARPEGEDLWLPVDELESATSWEVKPEGVCRGELCVPIAGTPAEALIQQRDGEQWLNVAGFWRYAGWPYARDERLDAWSFGASAEAQRASLATLEAPDFELPDLEGRMHRRSDHKGKKVLLALWASW